MIEHGFGHKKRPRQIDLKDRLPFVDRHLADRVIFRNAGVVDEKVDSSVLFDDDRDGRLTLVVDADVAFVKMNAGGAPVEMTAEGFGSLAVDRQADDGDLRSVVGKPAADRAADSAGAAGHDADASLEREIIIHALDLPIGRSVYLQGLVHFTKPRREVRRRNRL